MGPARQSLSVPDAIDLFGTLRGSRAPRDGAGQAKPVRPRRDRL